MRLVGLAAAVDRLPAQAADAVDARRDRHGDGGLGRGALRGRLERGRQRAHDYIARRAFIWTPLQWETNDVFVDGLAGRNVEASHAYGVAAAVAGESTAELGAPLLA